ncbi:MAG: hypothetical protein HC896_09310 [Bacteroidales bacterium]|nr:hypothetical protein [Bacteroidales bacterium]
MPQIFTTIETNITLKENKQLFSSGSINITYVPTAIYGNPYKTAISFFLAEVFYKALREHEQNLALYHFMKDTVMEIDHIPGLNTNIHLIKLLALSKFLGIQPKLDHSPSKAFFNLLTGSYQPDYYPQTCLPAALSIAFFDLAHNLDCKITKSQRNSLIEFLLMYLREHHFNFGEINSLQVLKQVFD